MIRECVIDKALNRLLEQLGTQVLAHPPASAARLAELESYAGTLPREFTIFLATCNGLRVKADVLGPVGHLWSIPEMLMVLRGTPGSTGGPGLVPVCGDPCGRRDWLVTEPGVLHGAVVRWDLVAPEEGLIASSFGAYVAAWVAYVIEACAGRPAKSKGKGKGEGKDKVALGAPPTFDARYTARHDPQLAALRQNADAVAWLKQLDLAAAGGADFE